MQFPSAIYLLIVEAVVLAMVFAVILILFYRKRLKSLREQVATQQNTVANDPSLDFLLEQIEKTKHKLAGLQQNKSDNQDSLQAVQRRFEILLAEKSALELHGNNTDRYWDQLISKFNSLITPSGSTMEEDTGLLTQKLDLLKSEIQTYEERLQGLERFKTSFFKLKDEFDQIVEMNKQLSSELESRVPVEERSDELQEMLNRSRVENQNLESQLSFVKQEFEVLMQNYDQLRKDSQDGQAPSQIEEVKTDNALEDSGDGFDTQQLIESQSRKIIELKSLIAALETKVDGMDRLQQLVNELSDNDKQMNQCLAIMEDENAFLRDQIQALLGQEVEKEEKVRIKRAQLEQVILDAEKNYAEQVKKYVEMERKYLDLYEQTQNTK